MRHYLQQISASLLLMASATAPAFANEQSPLEFTLDALQEACAPFTQNAAQSLEEADLALYCLSTGEAIVLSAASSEKEKAEAQETIASWIEEFQPKLASY